MSELRGKSQRDAFWLGFRYGFWRGVAQIARGVQIVLVVAAAFVVLTLFAYVVWAAVQLWGLILGG